MKRLFVTDAEQGRIPLNITRSLGRKRINITLGGDMRFATPYFSTYCEGKVVYPSASMRPAGFKKFMFNYIKKNKFDVVFPVMNETTTFFSKYKDELSKYTRIPIADYKMMKIAMNKSKTFKIAKKIKIPHPKTYHPESIEAAKKLSEKIKYPVIVKPKKGCGAMGVKLCRTKKQLIRTFKFISRTFGNPIIQDYIPGSSTVGVSCLFDYKSRPKAVFAHKRLREYPVNGGPSTLRESIRHLKAEKVALKLLKELKWIGVAMVEFKIDPRDGKPKLMEINPRFWGSLSLPIFAGVDFPYLLYKLAMDGNVKKVKRYRIGIKSRWLGGDFLHLLFARNKLELIPEFFDFSDKKTFCEDFAHDDPIPFLSRPVTALNLLDRNIRRRVFKIIFKRGIIS